MLSKRKILSIVLLFTVCVSVFSSVTDSIKTTYSNSVFTTYCQVANPVSDSITNVVVNKFVQQMCYDIRGLFTWGLKGMSLSNVKDELLYFDFRETKYNKETGILRGIGDVIVPGVTRFNNVSVDSKVTLRTYTNAKREVKLELAKPNLFIKSMVGSFFFVPKKEQSYGILLVKIDIQFDWFFNVFVTKSTYKKIMEWRIRQMLLNVREECMKRQKLITQ